jgi:hypothetical protein
MLMLFSIGLLVIISWESLPRLLRIIIWACKRIRKRLRIVFRVLIKRLFIISFHR